MRSISSLYEVAPEVWNGALKQLAPWAHVKTFFWYMWHLTRLVEKDVLIPMGAFSQVYGRLEDWFLYGM